MHSPSSRGEDALSDKRASVLRKRSRRPGETYSEMPQQAERVKSLCVRFRVYFLVFGVFVICQVLFAYMLGLYGEINFDAEGDGDLNSEALPVSAGVKSTRSASSSSSGDVTLEVPSLFKQYNISVPCPKSISSDTESALRRARTQECRVFIAETACKNDAESLYPSRLQNQCPVKVDPKVTGHYLGCFSDSFADRILTGAVAKMKGENSRESCLKLCSESGFLYSGTQYGYECFCGNDKPNLDLLVSEEKCDTSCPGDAEQKCGGYLTMNIYQTGLIPFKPDPTSSEERETSRRDPARIVYLLTVSGRSVRQVRRLVRMIYHRDNYILIHVDSRQDYMYRELSSLEEQFPKNVKMVKKRFATIWGGASLLQMLLHCMEELLELDWDWDFVMNLSESDYPVKTPEELVSFLSRHRGRNFVKSHGRETSVFIRKQGLDRTFVECDNHMWRVGHRKLPAGIQIDGGSDWICLHKNFASYVVNSEDQLVAGLKSVFKHSLLPAEAFFHIVLRNSRFCSTTVNNNLHLTNWKRKQGCKCQHKAVVDWCGCSPNDFRPMDWQKINNTAPKSIFFARKFEAVVNQGVINSVDKWLMGDQYDAALKARHGYWQNMYHHEDASPKPKAEVVTLSETLARMHLASKLQSHRTFSFQKVLEVTSYQHRDRLEGILIKYQVTHGESVTIIEALVQHKAPQQEIALDNRDAEVIVGTEFDPKEVMFRNIYGAIGPESSPSLLYRLSEGPDVELTFLVFDPVGQARHTTHHVFNSSAYEDVLKLDLASPMTPGEWTVLVLNEEDIVGQFAFLVTPLLESTTSQADLERLHLGSLDQADLEEAHRYQSFFETATGNKDLDTLWSVAQDNAKKTGRELSDWIAMLAKKFYRFEKSCFAESPEKGLPPCKEQEWSSEFEDPKSTINGVDPSTGKLY